MSEKPNLRKLVRNFIIELAVYGVLLVVYFFAVLQFLGGMLSNLFYSNMSLYAIVGLALIITQAVVLEAVTSYLIRLLHLDRLE